MAPEEAAERVTAHVSDLDHDARGVARVEGKVVFVEGGLPGETVALHYTKRGRHYDQARAEEVLEASPDRVNPPCPVFGLCGGCSLQHLAGAAQIRAKEGWLKGNLEQEAGIQPEQWLAPLDGPHWGYRAKARLSARQVRRKGVLVGFRERASRYVTQMDACPVLDPRLDALIEPLKGLIAGMSRPDRIPQAEVAASEGDAAVVVRHLTELTDDDRARLHDFQAEQGVVVETQSKGPDTAAPVDPDRPADLHYTVGDPAVTLRFASTDFVQVNAEVNRRLVARVLELLNPQPDDRVLDLFCGLGNFAVPLAARGAQVRGIEGEQALVKRAQSNAAANGVAERTAFRVADLTTAALTDGLEGETVDKVLLDPPRSGAVEAVKQIGALAPRRIVYVSCNPATLARDAGILGHMGYNLTAAGVANMFPHTAHVESIACFDARKEGNS